MSEEKGYTMGRGGRALLLLHAPGQTPDDLRSLAGTLAEGGLTVRAPALFEPGAHWSDWLRAAREAYTALAAEHGPVSVCALGESAALALLLAEEYAPDQLALVPLGRRSRAPAARFALRALDRRARRGLFALEGRPAVLLCEADKADAARQARRLCRLLRSCLIDEFPGGCLARALAEHLPA